MNTLFSLTGTRREILCLSVPLAPLTVAPFVTLCSCEDKRVDGGFIFLWQPIYGTHLLLMLLFKYRKTTHLWSSASTSNTHVDLCLKWPQWWIACDISHIDNNTNMNDVALLMNGLLLFPTCWLPPSLWFAQRLSEVYLKGLSGNKRGGENGGMVKIRGSGLYFQLNCEGF